jgi:hypothetical protein
MGSASRELTRENQCDPNQASGESILDVCESITSSYE